MELIKFDFNKNYNIEDLVVALGEFDGLHLAHQTLINKTINFSKELNVKSAIISFDPHPDFVLKKRRNQGYITPLSVKAKSLEELGIDYFIVVPFTEEFGRRSPLDFEKNVLEKFNIKKIVVGFDYRYGYKGAGTTESLKEKYPVFVLNRIDFLDHKMGSYEVRELLMAGEVEEVTKILGRFYNITGKVVSGNQVGQKIGIRTANVTLDEDYHRLKKGVYGVIVTIDGRKFLGVCNIGNNPTINYVQKPRLEVHILDFNEMIYDKIISVDFSVFIREERKFDNVDDLVFQINQDIENAKRLVEVEK